MIRWADIAIAVHVALVIHPLKFLVSSIALCIEAGKAKRRKFIRFFTINRSDDNLDSC
jgi:hypothetical protein